MFFLLVSNVIFLFLQLAATQLPQATRQWTIPTATSRTSSPTAQETLTTTSSTTTSTKTSTKISTKTSTNTSISSQKPTTELRPLLSGHSSASLKRHQIFSQNQNHKLDLALYTCKIIQYDLLFSSIL